MTVATQINQYIQSLPKQKGHDLQQLHEHMINWMPHTTCCFEDGLATDGKIVTNPTIGYGSYLHHFANGTSKAIFQIGISANSKGISIYLMGIRNKLNLVELFGSRLGKAKVTNYCIQFKSIEEIQLKVLHEIILMAVKISSNLTSEDKLKG